MPFESFMVHTGDLGGIRRKAERLAKPGDDLYAPHYYRHMMSAIHMLGHERGTITAQTTYTVFRTMADPIHYGETEVYSVGKYGDKVVCENDIARFQENIVIVDTGKMQSLLVMPLESDVGSVTKGESN